MLMSLFSHILCAWFAFLLPCYSTFKALSHRPLSEPDLERWAKYWTVIGAFVAMEYTMEWALSWFPFYWEVKTIFLLFLSLPQSQGSTFIYHSYLHPFLTKNEVELDAGIVSAQRNTLTFIQTRLSALFDIIWRLINKNAPTQEPAAGSGQQRPSTTPSGPLVESVMGLWRTYGPSVMGALPQQYTRSQPPDSTIPAASTTSFQAGRDSYTAQRGPRAPDSGSVTPHTPIGTPFASSRSSPPPFPEPQLN